MAGATGPRTAPPEATAPSAATPPRTVPAAPAASRPPWAAAGRNTREVVRALRRPGTLPGHARELVSAAVTAAVWPFGWADRGLVELRRTVKAEGPVPDGAAAAPVLMVHGYGANKSNWFFLERELRDAGFSRVHALNYNPLRVDVAEAAAACARRARELMDHFGVPRIHLVGHSMGGIVARWAVQVLGLEGVETCVTIASPHEGAPLARFAPGPTAAQLRPGSAQLARLRASSRPLPTRFVAYYSNLDLICPARSARITDPALRATNVLVKDEGHLSILLSRRLARSVADQLAAGERLAGAGAPVAALRARRGAGVARPVPARSPGAGPVDRSTGNPPAIHRLSL